MSATNGASPELVASLALRRAYGGAVAKSGDHYLDRGSLTPSHLAGAFDEFIAVGLLALGDPDPYQLRWVTVTDAGHVRYAQLRSYLELTRCCSAC